MLLFIDYSFLEMNNNNSIFKGISFASYKTLFCENSLFVIFGKKFIY